MPLLVILGVGVAQILWHFINNLKIISVVAGGAASLCLMVMATVWGIRNSISSGISAETLSAITYEKRLRPLIASHRRKAVFYATLTAVMALLTASSVISIQLTKSVWQWMVLVGGGAVGFAVYVFLLVNYWEHQIQIQKELMQYQAKLKKERDEMLGVLGGTTHSSLISPKGWLDGPPFGDRS